MIAETKLIAALKRKDLDAIAFVAAVQFIFNEYDKEVKLFGRPLNGKLESDFNTLETEIIGRRMSGPIDNPDHEKNAYEFTLKDQLQILEKLKYLNIGDKKTLIAGIINEINQAG